MSLHRYIEHADSVYATALAGGGAPNYISSSDVEPIIVGQLFTAGVYYIDEGFLSIDTSAVLSTPSSATLTLGISFTGFTHTVDIHVAVYDWGASIGSADWRDGTALAALTPVGTISSDDLIGPTVDIDIDPSAINVGGITRLIVYSAESASATAPSGDDTVGFDGDGGSNPPSMAFGGTDLQITLPLLTGLAVLHGPTVDGGDILEVTLPLLSGAAILHGPSAAREGEVTMPLLSGRAGLFAPAVGRHRPDDDEPLVIDVVNTHGVVHLTLTRASCPSVTENENAPDEATVTFPQWAYDRDDVHVFSNGEGALHEIRIMQGGRVLFWGPAISASTSKGVVTLECRGVDWYLTRLFLDGQRDNLLANPSFETGTLANWTPVGTFATVTGDWTQRGDYSVQLLSFTHLGDHYLAADPFNVTGTGVGTLLTITVPFMVEGLSGHARTGTIERVGLYVEALQDGAVKANNYYPIDQATPTGETLYATTTIRVPANTTWTIRVRLYSPPGIIYWDDGQVVAMQSVSTAQITGDTTTSADVSKITRIALQHVIAKFPSLNIGLETPNCGVKQVKHIQWADHVAFMELLAEYLERDDCFDYSMRYTETTRTFAIFPGRKGLARGDEAAFTFPRGNVAAFTYNEDGSEVVTDDTELAQDTGDGPDRAEGHDRDTSRVGGLVLQAVNQAPQDAQVNSLDPIARDVVDRNGEPAQSFTFDVYNKNGIEYDRIYAIGDTAPVELTAGWATRTGRARITKITRYPSVNRKCTVTAVKV